MRKLAFTLILVLSTLLTLNAFAGDLEPSTPPCPTMHTLNEIYDQIVQNAVPRYEYKYFKGICNNYLTIHNGSGVVHSIIFGCHDSVFDGAMLMDGNDIICVLDRYNIEGSQRVIPLDIGYKNSLKLRSSCSSLGCLTEHVTVVYKPDN